MGTTELVKALKIADELADGTRGAVGPHALQDMLAAREMLTIVEAQFRNVGEDELADFMEQRAHDVSRAIEQARRAGSGAGSAAREPNA